MLSSHERVSIANSSSRIVKVYENYSKVITHVFNGDNYTSVFEITGISLDNCITEVRDGLTNSIVLTDVFYDTVNNKILIRTGAPLETGESLKVIVTTKVT